MTTDNVAIRMTLQECWVIFILLAIRKWKSLENSQDFFVKTKTLLFVLEAPRDQDFGLEDYISAVYTTLCKVVECNASRGGFSGRRENCFVLIASLSTMPVSYVITPCPVAY